MPSDVDPRPLGTLLSALTADLEGAGVALARDEARDIVAAVLDVPRLWPSTNKAALVDSTAVEEARSAAAARARGKRLLRVSSGHGDHGFQVSRAAGCRRDDKCLDPFVLVRRLADEQEVVFA